MSILVVTRIALSSGGEPSLRRLKANISGQITIGNIGRFFWPNVGNVMTCSAIRLYNKSLEKDAVDVVNPEETFAEPKNKIVFDFVQSNATSVITPPDTYTLTSTANGPTMTIHTSANQSRRSRMDSASETASISAGVEEAVFSASSRQRRDLLTDISAAAAAEDTLRTKIQNPEIVRVKRELPDSMQPQRLPPAAETQRPQIRPTNVQEPPLRPTPVRNQQPELPVESPSSDESDSSHEIDIPPQQPGKNPPFPNARNCIRDNFRKTGKRYDNFFKRLEKCSTGQKNIDAKVHEALTDVMADYLKQHCEGHSWTYRRKFSQHFLRQLVPDECYDLDSFSSVGCTGSLDRLFASSSRKRLPDPEMSSPGPPSKKQAAQQSNVLPQIQIVEQKRGCDPNDPSLDAFYKRTESYRFTNLLKVIHRHGLSPDPFFYQFPHLCYRPDLLERDFLHVTETDVDFPDVWTHRFIPRIAREYERDSTPIDAVLNKLPVCDPSSLLAFVQLASLLTNIPLSLVTDVVITVNYHTDEEAIELVRTTRRIKHPVILAYDDGFKLLVGDAVVFQRVTVFAQALAQLIQIHHILSIPPEKKLEPLFYVLDKMYGIKPAHNSRGASVFQFLTG